SYVAVSFYPSLFLFHDTSTTQIYTLSLHDALPISTNDTNLLNSFVDSTGQIARITTFMKDIGTEKMEGIKADIEKKAAKVLPEDRYDVTITGKALVFMQGTKYLVKNLITSLGFAIFLISLLMAYLFRSFRMIIISLIPNILP